MKEIGDNKIMRIVLEFQDYNDKKVLTVITMEKVNRDAAKQYKIVYKK